VLAGVLATSFEENPPCDTAPSVDGSGMCILVRHPSAVPILVMTGLGAAEVAVSTYLLFRPQPIDETEARSLADAYNRRLRRRLGLPDVVDRARVQDLAVVPYVGQRQAGVVLTARF